MGLEFGHLGVKIRGIIYYKLSQHEQRAFAGWFVKGVPNTIRRVREEFFTVVPFFALSYLCITQLNKDYEQRCRKNPADYENDE